MSSQFNNFPRSQVETNIIPGGRGSPQASVFHQLPHVPHGSTAVQEANRQYRDSAMITLQYIHTRAFSTVQPMPIPAKRGSFLHKGLSLTWAINFIFLCLSNVYQNYILSELVKHVIDSNLNIVKIDLASWVFNQSIDLSDLS